MRSDVREAIESATTVDIKTEGSRRHHSTELVTRLVRSVIRELPADMSLGELLEEIGE